MDKEVLIYGDIYGFTAADFINAVNEVADTDKLVIRLNTNGGSPEYTYGMISKFKEFTGDKLVKVDGKAYSMGFFFSCFAEKVEALDVSQFMVHRAGYSTWFEESQYFTEALKENLASINKDLELAFRNKVDVAAFEELKGVTIKEIFSMEDRKDVFLTSKEAKKIGLISKVNKITPTKKAKIEAGMHQVAAKYNLNVGQEKPEELAAQDNNKPKKSVMTFEELKAKHPELFAQAKAVGVTEERNRVEAWGVFAEVDPKAVAEGISSGKEITMKEIGEFSLKKNSSEALGKIADGNADEVITDEEKAAKEAADALAKGEGEKTDVEKLQAKLEEELEIKL